jgi:hypothetical protein
VNRTWAAAARNNGQDRQVYEGVEGGRLEKDGDNDIDTKSKNLPRISLSEGRGEVSVMKVEGDFDF